MKGEREYAKERGSMEREIEKGGGEESEWEREQRKGKIFAKKRKSKREIVRERVCIVLSFESYSCQFCFKLTSFIFVFCFLYLI